MPFEGSGIVSACYVPQFDRFIRCPGSQEGSVGGEGNRFDPTCVSLEDSQNLLSRMVQQLDFSPCSIGADSAIGRKRPGGDPFGASIKGGGMISRIDIP